MNKQGQNSSESEPSKYPNLVPRLRRTESGRAGALERFPNYVVRQIGLKDGSEYPELSRLSYEYLKGSKGVDDKIFEYFADQPNAESLYVNLVQELDRCIISYFAFNWSLTSLMISQVLSVDSDQKKLKNMFMAATRKLRFERVIKDLKVKSVFSTLVEELKAIKCSNGLQSTEIMAPVAHRDRSPVLLFMGGGMGAGKSTVLKQILDDPFWVAAGDNLIKIEADAFKETHVIYQALNSIGHHHDMLHTSELVHQSSTDAASSLLVTALNEGRDVIMDGTFSWEPFVEQTVAMARNVHKTRYRMGVGYKVDEDGTIHENYWEEEKELTPEEASKKRPYRIELVGVVCDAYLAVVRGIRRAIATNRAVRVKSQLESHKRFASAFRKYCPLVDNARLYCTNAVGVPPSLIGWKDGVHKLLVDPDEIKCLDYVSNLNSAADSIEELYTQTNQIIEPGSVWNDVVLLPSRATNQLELKTAIEKIENPTA
jgi:hypothetical protein